MWRIILVHHRAAAAAEAAAAAKEGKPEWRQRAVRRDLPVCYSADCGPIHGEFGRLCVALGPLLCDSTPRIFQPVDDGPQSVVRTALWPVFCA